MALRRSRNAYNVLGNKIRYFLQLVLAYGLSFCVSIHSTQEMFRLENNSHCSDWQSQGAQFTSLTWKFSGNSTTSLERRLRRNSGSRRVAHCFYPQYVRKLVGVSSTDLRRDGPVLRAHSGVTVSICTYSRVDQSMNRHSGFCVLDI